MKRSQLFLERRLPVFAELEEDKGFVSRLNFFLPAIDRFDSRQDIRACRKAFAHQLIRNAVRNFRVRKRAQREQNSLRHMKNSTEGNEGNKDCLQKQEQTSLS